MEPTEPTASEPTRRDFLKHVAVAATFAMSSLVDSSANAKSQPTIAASTPWYRRAVRWGQTNITEADADQYDIPWWREYWKRTQLHGVVINAGGIYAYYPSKFPLHYRPPQLKNLDLYGELAKAAHDAGLAVLARMDSSKSHEALYRAHPDWFAVDASGHPYKSGEFYLSCINGPYYDQFLPAILREIIERSHPEGITDNNWSGPDRTIICHCQNCTKRFTQFSGKQLPTTHDWNDPAYRQWIEWSYARRIEQWDFNNQITRQAGGADCHWIGMNGPNIVWQSMNFRDLKEVCARSEIIMLDNQNRTDAGGFQENALGGKLVHGMLGWDKLIPESMAMYQTGSPQFRFSAKPAAEARMWMLAGFAGGVQPWWHHVGAYDEDRRMYRTAEPVMRWHAANQQYLLNRRPVATVAVGWSQRNIDFFGQDSADERVAQPFRGFTQALVRARIPHIPVQLDQLDRDAAGISVLVLPNIGAMPDDQLAAVRQFVRQGGSLIATGQTSLFDQWGDPRSDFALADLFGVKGGKPSATPDQNLQSYLRLTPELRARFDGPKSGDEPTTPSQRHPVLAGFDETDILPYGGTLNPLSVDPRAKVLLTLIPDFPASPPEDVWMRQPRTSIPGLILNESAAGGRIAFLSADIDRRFALHNLPDHGNLLANLVRWAAKDSIPLQVHGPGLLNCELYEQSDRLVLHILNLTSAATWRAPIHELIPVGPLRIDVRCPNGLQPIRYKMLVTGGGGPLAESTRPGWVRLELDSILDHELVVIES